MHVALLLTALVSAAEASPQAPGGAPTEQHDKVLGIQASAGAPDGLVLAATVRPIPWLRADLGAAYNVLSFGIVGGATVIPWSGSVTPTLRVSAGRFFDSDVRDRFGSTFPAAFDPALARFGYHFFQAQAGLELGNQNGTLFFVRGGLAWAGSDLADTTYRDGDTTITAKRNSLSATVPSVQLGVLVNLW